jgi:hypothetical protein
MHFLLSFLSCCEFVPRDEQLAG